MFYINEGDFSMILITGFVTVVALVVLIALYNMYVQLIQKRNKVKEAMSGIDVQLNKRYSLIPNILVIAKNFMEHEKSLMEEVTALRAQAVGIRSTADTISKKIDLDNQIAAKMGQLMVNVENYPQLKSDQTMIQAMQTYSEVEEHVAAARRFYNSAVNDLNNSAEIFPSSIIASMINIRPYPFFEADAVAKQEIPAADFFKN